jgi:hypothetical protein
MLFVILATILGMSAAGAHGHTASEPTLYDTDCPLSLFATQVRATPLPVVDHPQRPLLVGEAACPVLAVLTTNLLRSSDSRAPPAR